MTPQQIEQVREALEHFARIEVPEGSSDGTWVAKTLFGNTQVTAFSVRKARAALSLLAPVASEPNRP